jgi:hypothetical protein
VGCRNVAVVRQVSPGERLRILVQEDIQGPLIPDDEWFLRAMFDLFIERNGNPVSAEDVLALATEYEARQNTAAS